MMRKIYVCVSVQDNAEETVRFARACCLYVRDRGLMPMASHYMSHNDARNFTRVEDLEDTSDYIEEIRIRREELKMSDEAWIFINREVDEPMVMDVSMANDLEIEIQVFRKEDLCGLIII